MPRALTEVFGEASEALASLNFNAKYDELTPEAKAAIEAVKKMNSSLYQAVVNLGFNAAQARSETEIRQAKERADAAERKVQEVSAAGSPDIKARDAEWQAKLDAKDEEYKTKTRKLKDQTKAALIARDQATLESELIAEKVPKAMASVLAHDSRLNDRFEYDDDGQLSIRQAGQKIPFTPGEGQSHLGMLAGEIFSTVDKSLLVSDADGNGSGADNGGVGGGKNADANFFQNLRKKTEDSEKVRPSQKSLRERVSGS